MIASYYVIFAIQHSSTVEISQIDLRVCGIGFNAT